MKTTFLSLLTGLLALSAFGQTPSPTPSPDFAATASPFAAPPAPTMAPAVIATPTTPVTLATPALPSATPSGTATPGSSVTLTLSTSATPSADDAIDSMIEKKIRRHFDFSSDRHHSSSSNSSSDDDMAWLAVPIVFIVFFAIFGMPVLIVAVILYFSFSKNRAMHKTVRMMVEKGQPVPESLLNPPPVVRQRSDLRRAIKWMLVGLGLMIFFGACNDWEGGAWSIGIIPFLIGAGYLIFWRLDLREPQPATVTQPVIPPTVPPPVPPSSPSV